MGLLKTLNPATVCRFCQEKDCVSVTYVQRGTGHTSKAKVAAAWTLGTSLLFTGIEKKKSVVRLSCSNCNMTWED